MNKAKSLAHEVSHRHREEKDVFEDDAPAHDTMQYVKVGQNFHLSCQALNDGIACLYFFFMG